MTSRALQTWVLQDLTNDFLLAAVKKISFAQSLLGAGNLKEEFIGFFIFIFLIGFRRSQHVQWRSITFPRSLVLCFINGDDLHGDGAGKTACMEILPRIAVGIGMAMGRGRCGYVSPSPIPAFLFTPHTCLI